MAKKKRSSRTRDASPVASTYNAALETGIRPEFQRAVDLYYGIDRRTFRPDESTRPPTANRPYQGIVTQILKVRQKKRAFHAKYDRFTNPFHYPKQYLRTRLGFSTPRRIEACIRRKVRKEVIHAKRKAGKSGQRKPIRNIWSAISCSGR